MKIQLIRANKFYNFNLDQFRDVEANFPVYLVGTVAWGLSPSHQLVQRGPFQNGDTYVGYRLDPRVFQLPIVVPASSVEDMLTKRTKLAKIFRMGDDDVQLRLSWTDDVTTYERSILGRIVGGLQMDTDSTTFDIKASIQIKANDPTWYDTFGTYLQLSGTVAGTPTPYPKPYPVTYGASIIDKTTTVTYDGSADSYPVIQITGPITNFVAVDTLGHQIQIPGTISAGDTWTIDLSYAVYTVIDSTGANRFGNLSIYSNLVDWRIYCESDTVPNGINTISVSGSSTTVATDVEIYFASRYIGV